VFIISVDDGVASPNARIPQGLEVVEQYIEGKEEGKDKGGIQQCVKGYGGGGAASG